MSERELRRAQELKVSLAEYARSFNLDVKELYRQVLTGPEGPYRGKLVCDGLELYDYVAEDPAFSIMCRPLDGRSLGNPLAMVAFPPRGIRWPDRPASQIKRVPFPRQCGGRAR